MAEQTYSLDEMKAAGIWMKGNGIPLSTNVNLEEHVHAFLELAAKIKIKMLARAAQTRITEG